jgi:hypothetical protein
MALADKFRRLVIEKTIARVMRSRRETPPGDSQVVAWVCPNALGLALLIASANAAAEKEIPGVEAPGV